MTQHEDFAELLRRLREDARLSQNALARAAGIDPTNLNRIERRRQGVPRQATVLRIIRGLGLSLADQRAQQLLLAAGGSGGGVTATGSELREEPAGFSVSLEPTVRELRATLFRALELVTVLEALVENTGDEDDRE